MTFDQKKSRMSSYLLGCAYPCVARAGCSHSKATSLLAAYGPLLQALGEEGALPSTVSESTRCPHPSRAMAAVTHSGRLSFYSSPGDALKKTHTHAPTPWTGSVWTIRCAVLSKATHLSRDAASAWKAPKNPSVVLSTARTCRSDIWPYSGGER